MLFIIEIPMLILIEQVLKQYWYVSRCANNELAPCILKLKNNTEWKQTTVTEITENRFGNFRFWGENMLDRFGFFSFSSPGCRYSLEVPLRGTSNGYPQHIFLWRNKKRHLNTRVVQKVLSLIGFLSFILGIF